ncbi:hypothetical protein [Janthinobacterium sp.]|uniref:hypothetical protein n=1 Tax=Janthinobacterium sp. TaxID=1871054 RepID=UPI0025C2AB7A|nr:hypothetical protein [Janthinobacterium sp.]
MNPSEENSPKYIDLALEEGFDAEVDIRFIDDKFYLGHYEPQYRIPIDWLLHRSKNLWIHCRNYEALVILKRYQMINCFWHQRDDITLTTKGYIWAYPGKQPINGSIAVLPELFDDDISQSVGICSDMIGFFKENYG